MVVTDVRVRRITQEGKMRAIVSITLDQCCCIKTITKKQA